MASAHRIGFGLATLAGITMAAAISAQDWPQWRGPNRDGAVTAFTEPSSWPDALKQRWQIEVGEGYATPILVGQRVYMFTRQKEEEVMTALDAASGETVWRSAYPAPFNMFAATARHGPGPKSTPTYADGRLFTLGMSSIVTAFDASSGRQIWQKPATKAQPQYHTAMSPVVDGNRVIVHVGGPNAAALTAFDAATGNVQWTWDGDSPAYGSPMVAEFGGVRQVVVFTHQNLIGVAAATGELLWKRPFTTPSNTTAQTPIIYRDTIIQAGRENGFTAFRPTRQNGAWTTGDLWQTKEVSLHMTNGVAVDGVLYGLSHLNSGQYFALDLDTGRVLWKSEPRQADNAAIVRAGHTIFSLEDDADMVVMKASREAFTVIHRYPMAMSATWAQPAISGNRFFVKDVTKLTLWTLN
ncbi:MAG TPA: PQQ-binding-like beta-propeller repeat protein [Terriglobia bacterium]|nr:PQQ-binding-like beta-propeller repeat protein [Terriglobia bacterium]